MVPDASQRGNAAKLFLPLVALLALGLGIWGGQHWFGGSGSGYGTPPGFPGTVLPGGKAIPAFELRDDHGKPFVATNLLGKWTLLFFGYTHCPDVCPTTLGTLKTVWDGLGQSAQGNADVAVVFVSVDPERDDIEHLKTYVDYFDPAFVGVTGSSDELLGFSRSLGAMYEKAEGSSADNYLVNHTAAIFLIDPEGKLAALLSPPHDAGKIVNGINALRH